MSLEFKTFGWELKESKILEKGGIFSDSCQATPVE